MWNKNPRKIQVDTRAWDFEIRPEDLRDPAVAGSRAKHVMMSYRLQIYGGIYRAV